MPDTTPYRASDQSSDPLPDQAAPHRRLQPRRRRSLIRPRIRPPRFVSARNSELPSATFRPSGIVLICLAAVAVIVGIFAFHGRPKPQGAGSINFVAAAEVPGQDTILAAITLTLRNTANKPLWIHTLKAELTTADDKTSEDEAASAVDLDRYYQAFPALKESSEPPLSPETKLLAGTEQSGTIIVSFKVTKEAFDQRKSLTRHDSTL